LGGGKGCRGIILRRIRENHNNEPALAHPLSLVAKAYGLRED
jgi:hypothetical protein